MHVSALSVSRSGVFVFSVLPSFHSRLLVPPFTHTATAPLPRRAL